MSDTSFDPVLYLQQLDPEVDYSCNQLTGGVVNITIRAAKDDKGVDTGKFPGQTSLILKHAPPYIAGRGPSAPMTLLRQTNEAHALSLFSPVSPLSLSWITQTSSVAIPAVLHYDQEASVLVLSDLGRLPNLSDVFGDLGGQTFGVETPKFAHGFFSGSDQTLTADQASFFWEVGSRLGSFFARLHSPETCAKILTQYPLTHFQIPEIWDVVLELAIKPVPDQLKLFPDLASKEEAEALGQFLVEDFVRDILDSERSFTLGDSWTGAVLVSSAISPADPRADAVGVIDWEFAGFGRGVHGDMSQFLAHLELLRISAQQDQSFSKHLKAVDLMIASLTRVYSSVATGASHDKIPRREEIRNLRPRDASSLKARKMRSAFLSHGAEMINVAFWKTWVCVSPKCQREGGKHTKIQHECILIRSMVEQGLWFLRHACQDVDRFCQDGNWKIIEEKAEAPALSGRKWLIDLF